MSEISGAERAAPSAPPVPGLARRLAAFLYEGVLLFAVAMAVGLIYSPLFQQRSAVDSNRPGLMLAVGLGFGVYFVYFWIHGGQTLPMKTWRIRLVTRQGLPLTPAHALLRYVLSFAWWVLPVLSAYHMRKHGLGFGAISFVGLLGLIGYAALSRVLPERQFLHDVVAGTRLTDANTLGQKTR